MICVIVLIVFGILGIFSASHRKIAGEAFRCVFRQSTFRKCDSGIDIKIKSSLVAKLMKFNQPIAKLVYKRFGLLSWIFTILFLVSIIWTGVVAYNIIVYNNCYGPNADPDACFLTNGEQEIVEQDLIDCKDPLCETGRCVVCEGECNCTQCNGDNNNNF